MPLLSACICLQSPPHNSSRTGTGSVNCTSVPAVPAGLPTASHGRRTWLTGRPWATCEHCGPQALGCYGHRTRCSLVYLRQPRWSPVIHDWEGRLCRGEVWCAEDVLRSHEPAGGCRRAWVTGWAWGLPRVSLPGRSVIHWFRYVQGLWPRACVERSWRPLKDTRLWCGQLHNF